MNHIENLITRYPALSPIKSEIEAAAELMTQTYLRGGKILLCGNGGSAADCDHIAGELLKGFLSPRKITDESVPEIFREKLQGSLPAVSIPALTAALTASLNDLDPEFAYAQLLRGLGKEGDLLIGISTSGGAKNVLHAAALARAMGISVLSLTGSGGGALAGIATVALRAPEKETYLIQELHLPIYHCLCAEVEKRIFGA